MRRWGAVTGLLIAGALITCGLLAVSAVATVRMAGESDLMAGLFRRARLGERAEVRDPVQQIESGAAPEVNIESAAGRITLRTHDAPRVDVMTVRRARGASPEEARTAARAIEVESGVGEEGVALHWWPEQRNDNDQAVDWWITVPLGTRLIGRSGSGEAVLDGPLDRVEWRGSFGDVGIAGARGAVSVTVGSGDVRIRDITADAPLYVESGFGDIVTGEVRARSMRLSSDSGDLEVSDGVVDDDISLTTEFGDIEVVGGRAASIDLTSASGALDVSGSEFGGKLTGQTNFGDIRVVATRAEAYRLETQSGDVELDSASGPIHLVSDFGDLRATDVRKGEPMMETGSGSVEYRGSLATGAEALFETSFGSVDIWLPEDVGAHLDLETSFGTVTSDLPVTTRGRSSGRSLRGTVGNPRDIRVTARSQSGNVTLHSIVPRESAPAGDGAHQDGR